MRSILRTPRRLGRTAARLGPAGGDESGRSAMSRLGSRFGAALAGAAGLVFAESIAAPPRSVCAGIPSIRHLEPDCYAEGDKPPAHQTAYCGSYIGRGGNVATIADEPGYKVTIPATDTAKQNQLNQDLCQNPYKTELNIVCTDTADALIVNAGWTTWTLQHKK